MVTVFPGLAWKNTEPGLQVCRIPPPTLRKRDLAPAKMVTVPRYADQRLMNPAATIMIDPDSRPPVSQLFPAAAMGEHAGLGHSTNRGTS